MIIAYLNCMLLAIISCHIILIVFQSFFIIFIILISVIVIFVITIIRFYPSGEAFATASDDSTVSDTEYGNLFFGKKVIMDRLLIEICSQRKSMHRPFQAVNKDKGKTNIKKIVIYLPLKEDFSQG